MQWPSVYLYLICKLCVLAYARVHVSVSVCVYVSVGVRQAHGVCMYIIITIGYDVNNGIMI